MEKSRVILNYAQEWVKAWKALSVKHLLVKYILLRFCGRIVKYGIYSRKRSAHQVCRLSSNRDSGISDLLSRKEVARL